MSLKERLALAKQRLASNTAPPLAASSGTDVQGSAVSEQGATQPVSAGKSPTPPPLETTQPAPAVAAVGFAPPPTSLDDITVPVTLVAAGSRGAVSDAPPLVPMLKVPRDHQRPDYRRNMSSSGWWSSDELVDLLEARRKGVLANTCPSQRKREREARTTEADGGAGDLSVLVNRASRSAASHWATMPSTAREAGEMLRSRDWLDHTFGEGHVNDGHLPCLRGCEDVELRYDRGARISEGEYGVVYKGHEKGGPGRRVFALKWLKDRWFAESEVGFPHYLLREIDLLMRVKHPNVAVATRMAIHRERDEAQVVSAGTSAAEPATAKAQRRPKLFVVTEYAGHNLRSEIYHGPPLSLAVVRFLGRQMLAGLRFLHQHCILHRDMKPSNVLVDDEGTLKICDLGLARTARPGQSHLTLAVITLMYRAPELHFGVADYSTAVDMWSAGCILAEMVLQRPLFAASDTTPHLSAIVSVIGAPNRVSFPGIACLPTYASAVDKVLVAPTVNDASADDATNMRRFATDDNRFHSVSLAQTLRTALLKAARGNDPTTEMVADSFVDLIECLLQWNPKHRLSAAEALAHPFFSACHDGHVQQVQEGDGEAANLAGDAAAIVEMQRRRRLYHEDRRKAVPPMSPAKLRCGDTAAAVAATIASPALLHAPMPLPHVHDGEPPTTTRDVEPRVPDADTAVVVDPAAGTEGVTHRVEVENASSDDEGGSQETAQPPCHAPGGLLEEELVAD